MIHYSPTDGDPRMVPVTFRPRTAFLITQLGEPVPDDLKEMRADVEKVIISKNFSTIDAASIITGRDFLLNIWEIALSVPIGIALLHGDMRPSTIANVFYEMGLMQAYGKETLIIKTSSAIIPSDFVRTEYLEWGKGFRPRLRQFFDGMVDRATYYAKVSSLVENNPLLSLDYLRRAFLLTGEEQYRERARDVFNETKWSGRSKNSVEMLLVSFLHEAV